VVERITQGMWDRPGPGKELFIGCGAARAIKLRHPVGTHGPPLVMVALKPDVKEVRKSPVLGKNLRRQVAVIIKDRPPASILLVQISGRFGPQKKIIADESHLVTVKHTATRSSQRLSTPLPVLVLLHQPAKGGHGGDPTHALPVNMNVP
jgi:hypothetical protein